MLTGTNPLLHHTTIPMTDGTLFYNAYFTGQSDVKNRGDFGIGYSNSTTLISKLDVKNETFSTTGGADFINQFAGKFLNTGTYDVNGGLRNFIGVEGACNVSDNLSNNANYGGSFLAANNSRLNVGAMGRATYPNWSDPSILSENYGIKGIGSQESCASGDAYGVYGNGYGGRFAYGVKGEASEASRTAYAIYGIVPRDDCGTDWAGFFEGNIFVTGAYNPSDEMLKENIQDISAQSALDIIDQLTPKAYNYKINDFPSLALPSGQQYGLLAQDVATIIPNAVRDCVQPPVTDTLGNTIHAEVEFKGINYTTFIPILIAAVKDLKQQNEDLAQQIQDLQDCCHQGNAAPQQGQGSNQRMIELNNYAIILDQNSPNPFAEKTTITYVVPVDVKEAQIMFYDNGGRVLKAVQITERGAGSLLVYASNLSSGTYSYSLIADGKLIDTKKMVCQK